MYRLSIFMVILLCLSASSVTQVRSEENIVRDTTHNWNWGVPLGEYDYCEIIPINSLIKVGAKIGEQSLSNAGPV